MKTTKSQVNVSTSDYRFAHGKEPRGFGGWYFDFGNLTESSPKVTYSDAKKWAVNRACELGVTRVKVCS